MNRDQQFTFIDVTEQKQVNKKKIKSHVASDVNRKKRQTAVERYLGGHQHPGTEQSFSSNSPSLDSAIPPTPRGDVVSSHAFPFPGDITSSHALSDCNAALHIVESEDSISHWRKTYQDSWTVFTSSLSKGNHGMRGDAAPERPVAWLERRFSSDESAETLDSVGSAYSTHSNHSDSVATSPARSTSYISRIDPPASLAQAEGNLGQIKAFFIGKHNSTWMHFIRQDAYYYQHDYEIGTWRDCFHLAFDVLKAGKATEALTIMDASLGATSYLLKKQHPSLFYSLLEIMLETYDIQDPKLSSMIQAYLVQMTLALLGAGHPIAIVMKNLLSRKLDPQEHPEVMFQAMLDLIISLFGANHFQTLGTEFGSIRRHMLRGHHDRAQATITKVGNIWKQSFPEGALPCHMVKLENARVSNARAKPHISLDNLMNPAIDALEELAKLTTVEYGKQNVAANVETDDQHTTSMPNELNPLGRELLASSYHSLALHLYTHVDEVFVPAASQPDPMQFGANMPFATKVARVMLRSMAASPVGQT